MPKLVKQSITDIKQNINNDNKVYWFLIKNKKASVIAKGHTKTKAANNLFDKINEKPNKYIGARLWRLTITTHNEKLDSKDNPVYGDIRIMVENYIVMERTNDLHIKKTIEDGCSGPIWFSKDWLEYNKWKKTYIMNIVNKLVFGKIKIKVTGKNFYRMYFE